MACNRPSGNSCGISNGSFYLESFVPRHATAHIRNVVSNLTEQSDEYQKSHKKRI